MKSIVLVSIFLVVLCSPAQSMTVNQFMARDPKNPGMCTIDNMVVKVGDAVTNPHGKCEIWTCYENGHVSAMGCVKPGMREGCVEGDVINPYAAYPECCKRSIKCKTDYYS